MNHSSRFVNKARVETKERMSLRSGGLQSTHEVAPKWRYRDLRYRESIQHARTSSQTPITLNCLYFMDAGMLPSMCLFAV